MVVLSGVVGGMGVFMFWVFFDFYNILRGDVIVFIFIVGEVEAWRD